MVCTIKGCHNEITCKGMCSMHYYRVKRGGTPEVSVKQQMALRKCSIEDCGRRHFSNGYCPMHHRRWERHGDPKFINPKCNRDGNYLKRARVKTSQWKKDNKETYNAYLASRKARVRMATPLWADLDAIRQFYFNCPSGHHVDHIIPLNGRDVCGLHDMENLQYLPAQENLKKSNRF